MRGGKRRPGDASGAESHGRPRGLSPRVGQGLSLGIAAGAAVERRRPALGHRQGGPGARRRRIVVRRHRDGHGVGQGGILNAVVYRQRKSKGAAGRQVRRDEGRASGACGSQSHSFGGRPGVGERLSLRIAAPAAVEPHPGAFGRRQVVPGIGRRRVVDARPNRDVHGVRRRDRAGRVGHRKGERETAVGENLRRGEGWSGGACGTESHGRPRGLAPRVGQSPVVGIDACAAVERHRRSLGHRLVGPGVRRRLDGDGAGNDGGPDGERLDRGGVKENSKLPVVVRVVTASPVVETRERVRARVCDQGRRVVAGSHSPRAVPVASLGLVASALPVPRHRDRGRGAGRHANSRQVVHRDVHRVRDGIRNPVVHRQRKRERGVRRQGRSGERRSGGA